MINKNGCNNCKWNLDGEFCSWEGEEALLLEAGACKRFAPVGSGEE